MNAPLPLHAALPLLSARRWAPERGERKLHPFQAEASRNESPSSPNLSIGSTAAHLQADSFMWPLAVALCNCPWRWWLGHRHFLCSRTAAPDNLLQGAARRMLAECAAIGLRRRFRAGEGAVATESHRAPVCFRRKVPSSFVGAEMREPRKSLGGGSGEGSRCSASHQSDISDDTVATEPAGCTADTSEAVHSSLPASPQTSPPRPRTSLPTDVKRESPTQALDISGPVKAVGLECDPHFWQLFVEVSADCGVKIALRNVAREPAPLACTSCAAAVLTWAARSQGGHARPALSRALRSPLLGKRERGSTCGLSTP